MNRASIFFKTLKLKTVAVANIKSAIKRVQIAERNRLQNKSYKSAVKTLTKRYLTAVDAYVTAPSPEAEQEVQQRMAAAYSKIDKAIKCGVIHPNNGSRKKSRLAKVLKAKQASLTAAE
ncbi:MAG TPA: 30S ribosomal protein S20 [Coleofasciculaceae cyanobacterium]